MITISVSGRRATASDLVSLPTGNVQSIKVQFVFPLDDPLWQNALIVAVFAAKTPKGAWIVCPGVIDENKQSTIPGDVLRVADSEIYVGVRATYADNREVTTNVASLGKTVLGAGGEIVDTQIRDSELTQATEFLSDLYDLLQKYTHEHWNMQMLNNLSVSDEEGVLYDGKPIGVKVVLGNLPNAPAFEGKIVYCAYYSLSGFYYSDGTSWIRLTDSSNPSAVRQLLEQKHTHENGSTLDKFTESNGNLLFDGESIGSLIDVVDDASLLGDGDLGVATFDKEPDHLVFPTQQSGEIVNIDVESKNIVFRGVTHNATAIASAIASGTLPTFFFEGGNGYVNCSIMPVVDDISDNEYVDAGITLDSDNTIVATHTKNYAIIFDWNQSAFEVVKKDKIVQVDSSHIQLPISAIYTFEDLTTQDDDNFTAGWNLLMVTLDSSTYESTAFEFVHADDLNEYVWFVAYEDEISYIEGVGASDIYNGIIDLFPERKEKGIYVNDSEWKNVDDFQDVVPLGFTTYSSLVVRDDVSSDSIQDVPVYYSGNGEIVRLEDNNDQYIALAEDTQEDGLPIRYLVANTYGTSDVACLKVYYPVDKYSGGSVVIPKGWSANGTSTSAPDFSGFNPDKVVYDGAYYIENLMPEVQAALNSLSQCINVSADAMGHINVPNDAVVRFNGTIEPNRKYFFTASDDFVLTLPSVDFSKNDAQFVMYLNCTADIDITLPNDVLVSGEINSTTGTHKLFGSFDKIQKKWFVGCVDYEVQS